MVLICLISFSQFYCLEKDLGPLPACKMEVFTTIVNFSFWKLSLTRYQRSPLLDHVNMHPTVDSLGKLSNKHMILNIIFFCIFFYFGCSLLDILKGDNHILFKSNDPCKNVAKTCKKSIFLHCKNLGYSRLLG